MTKYSGNVRRVWVTIWQLEPLASLKGSTESLTAPSHLTSMWYQRNTPTPHRTSNEEREERRARKKRNGRVYFVELEHS